MEPTLPSPEIPTTPDPASLGHQPTAPVVDASAKTPVAQGPVVSAVPQNQVGTVATSDSPAIADDVDVIEKEWVDKAKKIVNATRDNPHEQEKQVSKLQADYLMKRYGKQIKHSE